MSRRIPVTRLTLNRRPGFSAAMYMYAVGEIYADSITSLVILFAPIFEGNNKEENYILQQVTQRLGSRRYPVANLI